MPSIAIPPFFKKYRREIVIVVLLYRKLNQSARSDQGRDATRRRHYSLDQINIQRYSRYLR